jgi:2-iminobutanoate/2-iminopropanoate deaminase
MYKAIGPYSLIKKVSNFYFISGIMPLNEEGLIEKEARNAFKLVMENLKGILSKEGLSFENLVKVTVYLTDPSHIKLFNEIYSSYFQKEFPARSLVIVNALPMNSLIEIEAIAYKSS